MKENKPSISIKLGQAQNSQRYETFTQFKHAFFLISTVIYTCISRILKNNSTINCFAYFYHQLSYNSAHACIKINREDQNESFFLFFLFFCFCFLYIYLYTRTNCFQTYYEMQVKMRLKSKITPYSAIIHLISQYR